MSWDSYITTLQGKDYAAGHCDKAVIIGLKDGSIWAGPNLGDKGFTITEAEAKAISDKMTSQDIQGEFAGKGIIIGGTKYMFLRIDEDGNVLGKFKDHGAVTIAKTHQMIMIAHTAEGQQHGTVNIGVNKLVEHLMNLGY